MEKNQAEEYPDKPNLSPVSDSSEQDEFTSYISDKDVLVVLKSF